MKNRFLLALSLMALSLPATFGQPLPALGQPHPGPLLPGYRQAETPTLTKFSLDFPGGTPRQLIAAIEKAMGKPVNAIIPAEHADVKLPPLKMNNVDVQQLFQAVESMSQKTEAYVTANNYGGLQSVQQIQTAVGFRTAGAISDDTIWYFYVATVPKTPFVPPAIPKVCRFYPLTSYLDRGLTVDDITTAIQTGWKMLGDKETPAISFHKETKLLIAVGEPAKLETIDAVLKALSGYAPPTGDTFTDRLHSLIQNAEAGIPPSPAKLAPPPAQLPPLPDKFPRTLRPPSEKTNSGN